MTKGLRAPRGLLDITTSQGCNFYTQSLFEVHDRSFERFVGEEQFMVGLGNPLATLSPCSAKKHSTRPQKGILKVRT